MRILICDDDPMIVEQLHKLLTLFFQNKKTSPPEIAVFSDGHSLLNDSGDKDIVFLDVEMPGFSGIYVGKELKSAYPNIIIFIVTSFVEYLDEAMRFHVFRYLTKPIERQRFYRNLEDALKQYSSISAKIAIETREGVLTVFPSDLVMIEAVGRKVIVHLTNKDVYSIHNLQYWLNTLPYNLFYQTHRSYIVNMSHILLFDHSTIQMNERNLSAYLTRRRYSQFKKTYLLYLESAR